MDAVKRVEHGFRAAARVVAANIENTHGVVQIAKDQRAKMTIFGEQDRFVFQCRFKHSVIGCTAIRKIGLQDLVACAAQSAHDAHIHAFICEEPHYCAATTGSSS